MAQIQRKWLSAVVTYKGGQSYSVGGETFHLDRAKLIMDDSIVNECRAVPGFEIQDQWEPVVPSEEMFDPHAGMTTEEKSEALFDKARQDSKRAKKVLRKKAVEDDG